MGAKSTKDISRVRAIDFIERSLHRMTDESIARLVEEVNDSLRHPLGLHNFRVGLFDPIDPEDFVWDDSFEMSPEDS